jgi:hypothetical protein
VEGTKLFSSYFNQTCTHRNKTGTNDFNESTFDAPTTFSARKDGKIRLVSNGLGELVETQFEILTHKIIKEGDEVDGRKVVAVEPMPGLGGSILYYRVYT